MDNKNLKPVKTGSTNWKRVLLMLLCLTALVGIVVLAYDYANRHAGQFEYPEGYGAYHLYDYTPEREDYDYYEYYYINENHVSEWDYFSWHDEYAGGYITQHSPYYSDAYHNQYEDYHGQNEEYYSAHEYYYSRYDGYYDYDEDSEWRSGYDWGETDQTIFPLHIGVGTSGRVVVTPMSWVYYNIEENDYGITIVNFKTSSGAALNEWDIHVHATYGWSYTIDINNSTVTVAPSNDDYSGGYYGIAPMGGFMPFSIHFANSFAQLRTYVDQAIPGTPRTIYITTNISTNAGSGHASAGLGSRAVIVVNGGREVTIRSAPGTGPWVWGQTHNNRRHFIVSGGGSLTIGDIILQRNAGPAFAGHPGTNGAASRGGIIVGHNGTFVMEEGSVIRGMHAPNPTVSNQGGATVVPNTRQRGMGGAVQVHGNDALFIMNDGWIHNTRADRRGGAVAVLRGEFIMNDGRISHSTARDSGGGVFVRGADSSFTMNGGVVGVMHDLSNGNNVNFTADFTGVSLAGATGTGGGGLGGNRITATAAANAREESGGGGVSVMGGAEFVFTGGYVTGNASNRTGFAGGGVHVQGTGSVLYFPVGSTGNIRGNYSVGSGAGILAGRGSTVIMNGGYVERNRTSISGNDTRGGGGIVLERARLYMNYDATINDNHSMSTGGGVRLRGGSRFVMRGGYITNNRAGRNGGGGVYMSRAGDDVEFIMYAGTISGNDVRNRIAGTAGQRSGGGLFINDGTFELRGPGIKTISNNTAQVNGGGIHWDGAGVMLTALSTGPVRIIGNTSTNGNGGGINIQGFGFSGDNFQVIDNHALTGAGGGIWANRPVTFIGSSIEGNTAALNGGGVFLQGLTMDIINTRLIDNRAGQHGGGISSNATMTLTNAIVLNNRAAWRGGGIHVSAGSLDAVATIIDGNISEGAGVDNSGGGGVFVSGGDVTLYNREQTIGVPSTTSQPGGSWLTTNAIIQGNYVVFTETRPLDGTIASVGVLDIGGQLYSVDGSRVYVNGTNVTITERDLIDDISVFRVGNEIIRGTAIDIDGEAAVHVGSNVYLGSVVTHVAGETLVTATTVTFVDPDDSANNEIFTVNGWYDGAQLIFLGTTGLPASSANRAIFREDVVAVDNVNTIIQVNPVADNYNRLIFIDSRYTISVDIVIEEVPDDDGGPPTLLAVSTRNYIIGVNADIHAVVINSQGHVVDGFYVTVDTAAMTVTLRSSYFIDGEAVFITTDPNTGLDIVTVATQISYNTAVVGGGIFMLGTATGAGTITMHGGIVHNNVATGSLFTALQPHGGGGIYVAGTGVFGLPVNGAVRPASTFHMHGGIVADNAGLRGGGVFVGAGNRTQDASVSNGGTFNLHGGEIRDNNALVRIRRVPYEYVYVYVPGEGNVRVYTYDTIYGYGGGVYMAGATRNYNCTLTAATTRGAGNAEGSTFNMTGGDISGNTAIDGGGVFMGGGRRGSLGSTAANSGNGTARGSTFNMSGGDIRGNEATRDGGGVYMDGGVRTNNQNTVNYGGGSTFYMSGGAITANEAINGNGGGVFLRSGVRDPGVAGGPASTARGARFIMTDGYITENHTDGRGGGVYMQGVTVDGATTVGLDTTITNLNATNSRFNLAGGSILNNTSGSHGGGVFVGGGTRSGAGGGEARGGNFIMLGGYIDGNEALGIFDDQDPTVLIANAHGGGVYVEGGNDTSAAAATAVASGGLITMNGGELTNNRALTGYGGGVFLIGNTAPADSVTSAAVAATLNMHGDGNISYNEAIRGGGVFVGGGTRTGAGSGTTVINGATLSITNGGNVGPGNIAEYGGGVYVAGGVRYGSGIGGVTGGVLRLGASGTVANPIRGAVSGNFAENYGGGIVVSPGRDSGTGAGTTNLNMPGAILTLNGGQISDNTAGTDGGGLWISNTSGANNVRPVVIGLVYSAPLTANIATIHNTLSGAINNRIIRAEIAGNEADNNGGGIWFAPGLTLELIDSRIHANRAGGFGGGTFVSASDGSFTNSTLHMHGGYLSGGATRGGGVYIQSGTGTGTPGIFRMMNTVAVTAAEQGGGIAVAVAAGLPPTIGLPADSTHGNGWADFGGGVYIQAGTTSINAARFYMLAGSVGAAGEANGHIRGNWAYYDGGGVYPSVGAGTAQDGQLLFTWPAAPANITITPRSFVGNVAERYGGGIFFPEGFAPSPFVIPENTTFSHNVAKRGGGVYLSPGVNLNILAGGVFAYNRAEYGGGAFLSPNTGIIMQSGSNSIRGNIADYDGGGMFVSGGTAATGVQANGAALTITGGVIGGTGTNDANRAQRGGGVFVQHGSHLLTGAVGSGNHGTFGFANGNITGNRAVYGGGVFIGDGFSDAYVNDDDDDDDNGGIVLPAQINFTPFSGDALGLGGIFNMTTGIVNFNWVGCDEDINNIIVGSGGGVWVARYGYHNATDVHFNDNRAIGILPESGRPVNGMGGAIFTMRFEYADPLRRVLLQWQGDSWTLAYSNLSLLSVNFIRNSAASLEWPPHNSDYTNPFLFNPNTGTTSQGNVMDHDRHPLNNFDINFTHGTIAEFRFFITCPAIYNANPVINPMSGVYFRLFRTISTAPPDSLFDADPHGHMVVFNPTTGASMSALWEEQPFANGSYLATSSTSNAIVFDMDTRFFYQLVQVNANTGFQIPFGQWRITFDAEEAIQPFNVRAVAGYAPGFISSIDNHFAGLTNADHPLFPTPYSTPRYLNWYVGSMANFQLPMAGGMGSSIFVVAGIVLLSIAAGAISYMFIVKKIKHQA